MARGKRVEIVKLMVDGVEVDAKECTKCGEVKPLIEYGQYRKGAYGRHSRCVECFRQMRHQRYLQETPNKIRKNKWTTEKLSEHITMLTEGEYSLVGGYKQARLPVMMRHNSCNHEWPVRTSHFIDGSRCPNCLSSKGERRIREWLTEHKLKYESQFTFMDCRGKRKFPFDFALRTLIGTILVEYDGEGHSRPVDFAGRGELWAQKKFRETQRNDRIKTEYCRANGIPLIRIDYKQFDEIEAILDRELSALGVTGKRNNTDNNDISRKEDAA